MAIIEEKSYFCPFCQESFTVPLTETNIACPKCKKSISEEFVISQPKEPASSKPANNAKNIGILVILRNLLFIDVGLYIVGLIAAAAHIPRKLLLILAMCLVVSFWTTIFLAIVLGLSVLLNKLRK